MGCAMCGGGQSRIDDAEAKARAGRRIAFKRGVADWYHVYLTDGGWNRPEAWWELLGQVERVRVSGARGDCWRWIAFRMGRSTGGEHLTRLAAAMALLNLAGRAS